MMETVRNVIIDYTNKNHDYVKGILINFADAYKQEMDKK